MSNQEEQELSFKERWVKLLEERGVHCELSDIPKFLVVHEVLGISLLGATWLFTYKVQPSTRLFNSSLALGFRNGVCNRFPHFCERMQFRANKAAKSAFLQSVKDAFSKLPS